MAPGIAIEAFDDAAACHAGRVGDLARRHAALCRRVVEALQEVLHTVVGTTLVVACDDHLAVGDAQIVAFRLLRNFTHIGFHRLVTTLADDEWETAFLDKGERIAPKQCHGVGVGSGGTAQGEGGASVLRHKRCGKEKGKG